MNALRKSLGIVMALILPVMAGLTACTTVGDPLPPMPIIATPQACAAAGYYYSYDRQGRPVCSWIDLDDQYCYGRAWYYGHDWYGNPICSLSAYPYYTPQRPHRRGRYNHPPYTQPPHNPPHTGPQNPPAGQPQQPQGRPRGDQPKPDQTPPATPPAQPPVVTEPKPAPPAQPKPPRITRQDAAQGKARKSQN